MINEKFFRKGILLDVLSGSSLKEGDAPSDFIILRIYKTVCQLLDESFYIFLKACHGGMEEK